MLKSGRLAFRRLHYRRVGFTRPLHKRLLALNDALQTRFAQEQLEPGDMATTEDHDIPQGDANRTPSCKLVIHPRYETVSHVCTSRIALAVQRTSIYTYRL